jgi:glycosyltransferase involved in cell wall biosynthesis
MAMELPVVATAVGGVPEAVADGETGVLVAADDAPGLVDAVANLLASPDRRAAMGAAARNRAAERFSVTRMLGELEDLYREVLDRGGS